MITRTADLLENPVRPNAWGSATEIPRLLGLEPTGRPQAELWMGAHPAAPSRLRSGGTLAERIEEDPTGELSPLVIRHFGTRLPFLMKIIAAERPLSLQAHPNLQQARAGYAAEQQRGVPISSPERSYVDPNHKPELIYPLTQFEAALRARPDPEGLREVVTGLLTVPANRRRQLVDAVVAACAAGSAEFPAEYATGVQLGEAYPGDPGVVIALLLNRITLQPGQAMFLAAGNMHCYLHGTAVEVMANSDNVLRGGLTGKHVDVPELLRVVDVADGPAPLMVPKEQGPGHTAYRPPMPDFRLDTYALTETPAEMGLAGPRIVLTVAGTAVVQVGPQTLTLPRGASAWLPAGLAATVAGSGELVVATTNL